MLGVPILIGYINSLVDAMEQLPAQMVITCKAFYVLLSTVGRPLERSAPVKSQLDVCFGRLKLQAESQHTAPQAQLELQDLIQLRNNRWIRSAPQSALQDGSQPDANKANVQPGPSVESLSRLSRKCNECGTVESLSIELAADPKDGELYCGPCWVAYEAEAETEQLASGEKAPRSKATADLKLLQQTRDKIISKHGYLDYTKLLASLEKQYGRDKYRWPHKLREGCNALSRLLCSVNTCIDAAVATHSFLTLHDLENSIMLRLRDFEMASSFEDLHLGSLVYFPAIVKHFTMTTRIQEQRATPCVSTEDVLRFVADKLKAQDKREDDPREPSDVVADLLQAYADQHSELATGQYCEYAELCLFVRAESFLTYVIRLSRRVHGKAIFQACQSFQDQLESEHLIELQTSSVTLFESAQEWAIQVQQMVSGQSPLAALSIVTAQVLENLKADDRRHYPLGLSRLVAPLLTCVFLDIPMQSEDAHAMGMLQDESLLAAVRQLLHSKLDCEDGNAEHGLIASLHEVEQGMFQALQMQSPRVSLLSYIQDHAELCSFIGALTGHQSESVQPVVQTRTLVDNLDGLLVDLVAQSDTTNSHRGLVHLLAQLDLAESRLCDLAGVSSFARLGSEYTTFLQLCTQHAGTLEQHIWWQASSNGHRDQGCVDCKRASSHLRELVPASSSESQTAMVDDCTAAIMKAICCAPCATDIGTWIRWSQEWQPRLDGQSLKDFLHHLDVDTRLDASLLELPGGRFVRYEAKRVCDFEIALEEMNPAAAAECLLGMAADSRDVESLPFDLLERLVMHQVQTAEKNLASMCLDHFILLAIKCIPSELCGALAAPVFGSPYLKQISDGEVRLIRLCKRPDDAAVLRTIGFALGKPGLCQLESWQTTMQVSVHPTYSMQTPAASVSADDLAGCSASSSEVEMSLIASKSDDLNHTPTTPQTTDAEGTPSSDICASIRSKFGIGLDLAGNSELERAFNELRGVTNRSIHRLAAELYSKEIHFALELLQNFDDNEFACGATPSVSIVLQAQELRFQCNEVGFLEHNVMALSSIGESTKSTHKGYIGHKGIGFKSVFKVTNRPQIHSRCYHLEFDSSEHGGLGYIVPSSIGSPSWWSVETGTAVVLPLSPEVGQACLGHVLAIQPLLLLFLNQLQTITIENHTATPVVSRQMWKVDLPATIGCGKVTCLHDTVRSGDVMTSSNTDDWLIVRQIFKANHVERNGIQDTEIAVALPLHLAENPPHREVYAFLPLRSYGMSFIIQADWVVPSSREAVEGSSPWNQWLRHELPTVIVNAFKELASMAHSLLTENNEHVVQDDTGKRLGDTKSSPEHGAALFSLLFRLVPLQALEFFGGTPRAVLTLLQQEAIVPVQDVQRGCVPPSCAVLRPVKLQPEIDHYTEKVLNELKLSFVHEDVVISESAAVALGFRRLSEALLLRVLAQAANRREGNPSWLSWLCHMLDLMQEQHNVSSVLPNLRKLHIIPLVNDNLGCFEDGPILQISSLQTEENCPAFILHNNRIMLSAFQQELLLHPAATMLLRRLGMLTVDTESFALNHLIPQMADPTNTPDSLISMLVYAKSLRKRRGRLSNGYLEAQIIKAGGLLVDLHGLKLPTGSAALHFGEDFRSVRKSSIAGVLNWACVSPRYLQLDPDEAGWVAMLGQLGVTSRIHIETVADEASMLCWEQVLPRLDLDQLGIVNEEVGNAPLCVSSSKDFDSSELRQLIKHVLETRDPSVASQLAAHLSTEWDHLLPTAYTTVDIKQANGTGTVHMRIPALWLKLLIDCSWLPSHDGDLYTPMELLFPTTEVKDLVGTELRSVESISSLEFASAIGVRMSLRVADVLMMVACWSENGSEHCTTFGSMILLYRWVHANATADELVQLSQSRFLWFGSPTRAVQGDGTKQQGALYQASDCVWQDKTGLLDTRKKTVTDEMSTLAASCGTRVVSTFYPSELKDFFSTLGVVDTPKAETYASILHHVADLHPTAKRITPSAMAVTFRILSHFAYADDGNFDADDSASEIAVAALCKSLGGLAIIPTMSAQTPWAALGDIWFHGPVAGATMPPEQVLAKTLRMEFGGVVDSRDFKKHGSGSNPIIIKQLRANLESFADLLDLEHISDAAQSRVETEGERVEISASALSGCWQLARFLQLWSAAMLHADARAELASCVQGLRVFQASKVCEACVYRSKHHSDLLGHSKRVECWLAPEGEAGCMLFVGGEPPKTMALVRQMIKLVHSSGAFTQDLPLQDLPFLMQQLLQGAHPMTLCDEAFDELILDLTELAGDCQATNAMAEFPWIPRSTPSMPVVGIGSHEIDEVVAHSIPREPLLADNHRPATTQGGSEFDVSSLDDALISAMKSNRDARKRGRQSGTGPTSKPGNGMPLPVESPLTANTRAGQPVFAPRKSDDFESVPSADELENRTAHIWSLDALSAVSPLLPVSDMPIPDEAMLATGRWGEELVFNLLQSCDDTVSVEWMNQDHEAGFPYDLKLTRQTADSEVLQVLVEVKSTTSLEDRAFPISFEELTCSQQLGNQYEIFRVWGARSNKVCVKRVANLWTSNFTILCQLDEHR